MSDVDPEDITDEKVKEIATNSDPEDVDVPGPSEEEKKMLNEQLPGDKTVDDLTGGSVEEKRDEQQGIDSQNNHDYKFDLDVDELPSNGLTYGYDEINARGIKVKEEKDLSMIDNLQSMNKFNDKLRKVADSCIDVDLYEMTFGDWTPVLLFLRFQTWTPEYIFSFTCPSCGEENEDYSYDLTDLSYDALDEDYEHPTTLSVEGIDLKLRVMKVKDEKDAEKFTERNLDGFKEYNRSQLLKMSKYASMVVDGTDFPNSMGAKIEHMENNLSTKQFGAIRAFADKYQHGIDYSIEVECQDEDCEDEIEIILPFTPELFYPSADTYVDLDEYRI